MSGSDEKLARVQALGLADHLINRHNEDWVEAVYRVTSDYGADHILETVGGAHLGRSLEAVAVEGRISAIGVIAGTAIAGSVVSLLLKMPVIQGIAVGHRRALEDLVRAVDHVGLKPVIDQCYAFADFSEALDHLERGPFGKVVIEIG